MGDSIPERYDSNTGADQGKTGNEMSLRIGCGEQRRRRRIVQVENK